MPGVAVGARLVVGPPRLRLQEHPWLRVAVTRDGIGLGGGCGLSRKEEEDDRRAEDANEAVQETPAVRRQNLSPGDLRVTRRGVRRLPPGTAAAPTAPVP